MFKYQSRGGITTANNKWNRFLIRGLEIIVQVSIHSTNSTAWVMINLSKQFGVGQWFHFAVLQVFILEMC